VADRPSVRVALGVPATPPSPPFSSKDLNSTITVCHTHSDRLQTKGIGSGNKGTG
jgi:hypothetical protein